MELTRYQRNRLKLFSGAVVAYLLFYFAGKFAGIPWYSGHQDSLLQHPHPLLALITVLITWLLCVAATTVIVGKVRVHAGIFCAALGLMALSIRGGTMTDVLQQTDSSSIFLLLILELILLGGIVALGFGLIHLMLKKEWLKLNWDPEPAIELSDDRLPSLAIALAFQMMIMLVLVYFLIASDKKGQSLIGLAISAYLASALARSGFAHVKLGYCPCAVPFIVGIIGYAIAFIHPIGLEVHRIDIPFGRPLPLDYASIAVAATCLGQWIGIGAEIAFDQNIFTPPPQPAKR